MNTNSHSGGLYCTEGSQLVSRPSVRISRPPGGNGSSSWNFLQPDLDAEYPPPRQPLKQADVNAIPITVAPKTEDKPKASFQVAENNLPEKKDLGAIYCVEGGQVRNRPSVKVRGEQKREYNIINFN